jgi:D-alanyl-D-alanine carboxypeptidase
MNFCCRFFFLIFAFTSNLIADVKKKAAIVIDYTNGNKVLFANNPDDKRYPASITKVMTIYLLFEAIKNKKITFTTKFKVSKLAAKQVSSKLGIKPGEKISVMNIIKALIVKSANDVAVVAAEGLSGSIKKFCKTMNRKSKQLGMKNTHFENPSGIPNTKQVSSPRDLAKLGIAIFRDFPQHWHLFSTKKFKYNGKTYNTHCKMLHWCRGVDGGKTGYITASGFNILVTAKKERDGKQKRVFAVVMGESSSKERDLYAAKLINTHLNRNTVFPKSTKVNKAKESLLEQIDELKISDQIVFEEEEIPISSTEQRKSIEALLNKLYENDEESIFEEEEIPVASTKSRKASNKKK